MPRKVFKLRDLPTDNAGRTIIPLRITARKAEHLNQNVIGHRTHSDMNGAQFEARMKGIVRGHRVSRDIATGLMVQTPGDDTPTAMCPECHHPFIYRRVDTASYRWTCEACGFAGGHWLGSHRKSIAVYRIEVTSG